jgi:anti-sigma-K factor RskA
MPSHRGGRARARGHRHDLAGAYALHALDEREQRQFTRHLRRCSACGAQIRGYQEVATALALAAAADPPPELRERVLAAAARTPQLRPPRMAAWRRVLDWLPRLPAGGWVPRLAAVTAVAAIAAVVVLGVVLAHTRQQLDASRAQARAIAAVLAATDVQTAAGSVATGGVTTVVLSADRRELVISTSGLAALKPGKTYELWLIGPSAAQTTAIRSAGLLPAAVAGHTTPVLASGLVAGDKLGLTVEPAGGSRQPTTTPVLLLSLPEKK